MAFKSKIKSTLARGAAITAGLAAAALAGTVLAGAATAGADTTFLAAETQLGDWLAGSGGRIITLIALGYAAAGAIARMSIGTILVPAGIGLLVGIGGPIVLTAVAAELPDAPMQIAAQVESPSTTLLLKEGF
jgi:conjugal transfer pilus assembly protein TraA